ncbi:diaminopimelate decarboxylase [Candidatus Bipolaricaulota bacterium]|nr:diaminopimelate decarboxylase [Candidatus Bipolaricaulota bacterium]
MDHPWLESRQGRLQVEGIPLLELAPRFGTPLYVYSAQALVSNVRRIQATLHGLPVEIRYAVKANPTGAILTLLAALGLGAEVVSGGELARARRAGFPPEKIVFTGVGKTGWELAKAVEEGVEAVVIESLAEIPLLEMVAGNQPVRVALRLNPGTVLPTHPYLATGARGTKFGLDEPSFWEALDHLRQTPLELVGLHTHLGSQLSDPTLYIQTLDRLLELARLLCKDGWKMEFLDLGGGFAIPQWPDLPGFPFAEFAQALRARELSGLRLLLEPGRAIVGTAGILLTTVLHTKTVHGRRFVVVDAGMNDFLRPSLYRAAHRVVAMAEGEGEELADVVGPICESGDFLAWGQSLPRLRPGDALAILDAGAYGATMASQYNSRPRPAEVLIAKGRPYLVKARETVEDLWRGEEIPQCLSDVLG